MKPGQTPRFLPGYISHSTDPAVFDKYEYLSRAVPDLKMLEHPETRRELTKANPLLFALLYMDHHFKDLHGREYGFSKFHLQLYKWAAGTWHQKSGLKDARDAFIAPRGSGKTTTLFNILPMWAGCHKYEKFVAAYGDSQESIQNHLGTFKSDLKEDCPLIVVDYPHMYLGKNEWIKEEGGDSDQRDSASFMKTAGGFVFAVKSVSSNSLGLKVGHLRPTMILLDDIERQGGDYSPHQAEKRRQAIVGGILGQTKPNGARVIMVGTNLMIGSIFDGLLKYAEGHEPPKWAEEEKFRVHYFKPFINNGDGTRRSIWPEMWPIEFLESEEHTESFAVDFLNQPQPSSGAYWENQHFTQGSIPKHLVSYGVISIDPAVSAKRSSDFTAMSVILYSRTLNRYEVVYNNQFKITSGQIKQKVEDLCGVYPEIQSVFIEVNQGGDMWVDALSGVPVRVVTVHNNVSKEMRAGRTLICYETVQEDGLRRVIHRTRFPELEAQMKAFPKVPHDDLVDSVTNFIYHHEKRLMSGRRGVVAGTSNRLRR